MKRFQFSTLCLLLTGVLFTFSCGSDDPDPMGGDDPIASFQFEVSETDFREVAFTNFSQNATSYAWDFGDGNTSTEESPTHTYSEGGDYTVSLTASNGTTDKTATKSVTITDPNSAIKELTGETSKVWKLSRNIEGEEYPIQVGPNSESEIWWALGIADPVGARPCIMEEEYIFNVDGTFEYDPKGQVFADYGIWNADLEGQCVDATDPAQMVGPGGEDLSAWGAGTFNFDYDVPNGMLTVNGLGAHLGLPKVSTTGEVTVPQPSVTYRVVSLETDGPVDKLVLRTDLVAADGYWQFRLVSYDNPEDEPDLPGAAPTTGFTHTVDGRTVTFENSSVNADSYSWDFGDGNTSTEENPTHTYAEDGSYTVVLSATNSNGTNMASANVVVTTGAGFTLETIDGGTSKVWKLNPAAGALAVGPVRGSGEWFATSEDDLTVRACTFDDTYTFSSDGSFDYNTNGDLWAEGYMGIDPAGCITEDMLMGDAAAWGSGSHTYSVTEATDSAPAYLTVTGTGAFIALPKAFNGGEYSDPSPAVGGSVTYEVLNYIKTADSETLILTIDISEGQSGGAWWTFALSAE